MKITAENQELVTLELGYRQSLTVAPGTLITVEHGVLWITAEQEDVILRGSDAHLVGEESQVLQALTEARIRIKGTKSAWFLQLA